MSKLYQNRFSWWETAFSSVWIQQSGSGEREREVEGGRKVERARLGERGRERECQNIQYAGGGLLQPVSFRLGGITCYWGGVETD